MTVMYQVRTNWTGFPGAPGFTNMYFETTDPLGAGANTAAQNVGNFWFGVKGLLPQDVTVSIDPEVNTIDDINGQLQASIAVTQVGSVGTGTGSYAAPVGAVVDWNTGAIYEGHRVVGRTFLVPLVGGSFEANGTLTAAAIGTIDAAASALRLAAGPVLGVWSRPFNGAPAVGTKPARPAHPGRFFRTTSNSVPDRAAVLRSRRD